MKYLSARKPSGCALATPSRATFSDNVVRRSIFAALALGIFAPAPANAISTVTIQPVSVCLDNGTGCSAAAFNTAAVKTFWQNQAGLTLNFLTPLSSNSTTFQTMDSLAEVQSLLSTSSGVDPGHPTSLIFWYADAAPGLQLLSLGFISGNGSWVASNITENEANIGFSRALGFNLGLALLSPTPAGEESNLMLSLPLIANEPFSSLHLNDQQRTAIERSRFVEDIAPSATPLPSAAILFGTVVAGGGLLWRRRRKTAG